MSNDEKYGLTFNFSLAMDGEDISMGVHVTDSTGIDISSEVETDDMEEGFYALVEETLIGIVNQKMAQEEETEENADKEDLQEVINSLEADNALLEARVEDLQNKLKNAKEDQGKTPYWINPDFKTPIITCDSSAKSNLRYKNEDMTAIESDLIKLFKAFM